MAGAFAWFEINTPDAEACRAFYTSVLGWTTQDMDMGPMGTYTMFAHGGPPFAGISALGNPGTEGMSPGWVIYANVEDVDATAEKVTAAGGSVLAEPFDIPTVGRAAFVADPHGGTFFLFKPEMQG